MHRIFDAGRPGWHSKIIAREMIEPTRALDSLLEEVAQPLHRELAGIVRLLLGASATDEDVRFCALSIMGQCVYYHHARTVLVRLYPEQQYRPDDVARMVEHISEFSLAAMRELTQRRQAQGNETRLKAQIVDKPARASGGVRHRFARRRRLRRRQSSHAVPRSARPRQVRGSQRRESVVARVVSASGTLAADDQFVLGTKVVGRLGEIPVDLGSRVKKGQAIARIDQSDYRLRVEQADAALQQSRVRLGLPASG